MSKKVKCCECDSFMDWALPVRVNKGNYELVCKKCGKKKTLFIDYDFSKKNNH